MNTLQALLNLVGLILCLHYLDHSLYKHRLWLKSVLSFRPPQPGKVAQDPYGNETSNPQKQAAQQGMFAQEPYTHSNKGTNDDKQKDPRSDLNDGWPFFWHVIVPLSKRAIFWLLDNTLGRVLDSRFGRIIAQTIIKRFAKHSHTGGG